MAVKKKEYLLSVNKFNKPESVDEKEAIALLLVRLLLLNPGSDPLHPDMGVGLTDFRYCLGRVSELQNRIENQITQYLPEFKYASVRVVEVTAQKICNIEITIDDTLYLYDSNVMPVTLALEQIRNN